jgi:hypothetical protein
MVARKQLCQERNYWERVVGSVDRSKQNFSYPIQTFKDCVASTHEEAGGYTSFKVA